MVRFFLKPYGLFKGLSDDYDNKFFTYNKDSLKSIIENNQQSISEEDCDLQTEADRDHVDRPLVSAGMVLLTKYDNEDDSAVVPVHSNSFYTGVLPNVDYVGLEFSDTGHTETSIRVTGGGGVESFGFNSVLQSRSSNGDATIEQNRYWSLADAIGTSSSFLSYMVYDIFSNIQSLKPSYSKRDVEEMIHDLNDTGESDSSFLKKIGGTEDDIDDIVAMSNDEKTGILQKLQQLSPRYDYWSMSASSSKDVIHTGFW